MAKALLGYMGGPDPRLSLELRRLKQRVSDLEAEVIRLQAQNDTLAAAINGDELLTVDEVQAAEPAMA